jgi:hypothetical protein
MYLRLTTNLMHFLPDTLNTIRPTFMKSTPERYTPILCLKLLEYEWPKRIEEGQNIRLQFFYQFCTEVLIFYDNLGHESTKTKDF